MSSEGVSDWASVTQVPGSRVEARARLCGENQGSAIKRLMVFSNHLRSGGSLGALSSTQDEDWAGGRLLELSMANLLLLHSRSAPTGRQSLSMKQTAMACS